MLNRRDFLKSGLTAGVAPLTPHLGRAEALPGSDAFQSTGILVPLPERLPPVDPAQLPWQAKIRCVGQTNFNEYDPAEMDVERWADFWHAAKADIVYVSVTGILAFYPSRVPFHRHAKYLKDRDLFGECAAAAKQRGMRVVARMSPDLNWGDALEAHPEWAMRNQDGSVQHSPEDARLFKTCMFTSYMDDYIPAIMQEVNARYDVDCFYANGWPPLGSLPVCYCNVCIHLPPPGSPAYWRAFTDRTLQLWRTYDSIAKEKKSESFFFANSGGNVRGGPNLDQLARTTAWFQADNQGRTFEEPEIWGCSLQGRVCNAVLDGKVAANVTAAYSTGTPGWRNVSKNDAELRMWLSQSVGSGMLPYVHFVGDKSGFVEDRRWQKPGTEFLRWAARHPAHLTPRRTLANIGIVIGQSTQLLYPGPATAHSRSYMRETTQGLYDVLLRGRFAFDFVHENRLDLDRIARYRALLLPNVAMLSDAQCAQLRAYVQAGGSLMASFETSLYDENLRPREEFGLAALMGIGKAGAVIGTNGNPYSARLQAPHPLLHGFTDTHWIAGAQNRVPLKPIAQPVLTVVPGFVRYPPELAHPDPEQTGEPAVVTREMGRSRLVWFPGDIERTYWITGHTDLLRLLHNAIRWVSHDEQLLQVDGPGLIELFGWETPPGYAVHLLNYNTPDAHHGWVQTTSPLGPQSVSLRLPGGVRVASVDLLRAETPCPFHVNDRILRFTVPLLGDYEVAAITFG